MRFLPSRRPCVLRQPTRAFTLIEMLLVLGAIALVMVIAFSTYQKVSTTRKAQEASLQMISIMEGAHRLKRRPNHYGPYHGITADLLRQAGLIPKSMISRHQFGGWAIRHALGGGVMVQQTNHLGTFCSGGSQCILLGIVFSAVPSEGCNALVGGLAPAFEYIEVNNVQVKTPQLGVVVEDMVEACAASDQVLVMGMAR